MNWTLFLTISVIIFWIIAIPAILYAIYDWAETEYFLWNHKRKWEKHLEKQRKKYNPQS